jgi:hypothetical protein
MIKIGLIAGISKAPLNQYDACPVIADRAAALWRRLRHAKNFGLA